MAVRLVDDGGDETKAFALAGDVVCGESAGFSDKCVGTNKIEQLMDLRGSQVVWEEDRCQPVECTGCVDVSLELRFSHEATYQR